MPSDRVAPQNEEESALGVARIRIRQALDAGDARARMLRAALCMVGGSEPRVFGREVDAKRSEFRRVEWGPDATRGKPLERARGVKKRQLINRSVAQQEVERDSK